MNRTREPVAATGGFTLLELIVVMGILTGFLVMLVQFVDSGVTLFQRGESGQNLADRATAASRAVREVLQQVRGPSLQLQAEGRPPRLLVQWLPFGLVPAAKATDPHVQFLRASAQLDAATEVQLRRQQLVERVRTELGDVAAEAIAARVGELLATTPLVGHGGLWLFPWPQADDAGGSYLQLRVGRFLPDQLIHLDDDRAVDPMTLPVPGSAELPSPLVQLHSRVLVEDLLYFELRFWSQYTDSWDERSGGSELVWDSARAGWLGDGDGPHFRLDRGPASLLDATDDVFPHAVHVLLVVGQDPRLAADGLLARDLALDDQALQLVNVDRFDGPADGGYVKVGPEWIHYDRVDGDELRGLQRGCRGSTAGVRPQGTGVRLGRTVEFTLPLLYGKDDWNG